MYQTQETSKPCPEMDKMLEVLKWIRYATKELQNLPSGKLTDNLRQQIELTLQCVPSANFACVDRDMLARCCNRLKAFEEKAYKTIKDNLGTGYYPDKDLSDLLEIANPKSPGDTGSS